MHQLALVHCADASNGAGYIGKGAKEHVARDTSHSTIR